MAAGEGFKTTFQGFDKGEVTDYIGKMAKEKKELENELKTKDDEIKSLQKVVADSEGRINSIKEEYEKKISDLSAQVKDERKKSEEFQDQIDDLKRKLKNGGGAKGGDSNADKRAEEIISSANAKARQIIADAERKAASMGSSAPAAASAPAVDASALMNALKNFQSAMSDEMQKLSSAASKILSTPAPAASAPAMDDGMFGNMDNSMDSSADNSMGGFEDMMAASSTASNSMDDIMDFPTSNDMDMGMGMNEEISPLEPEKSSVEMTDSFDNELLSQSVPSNSLEMGDDMFGSGSGIEIGGNDDSVGFDMGGMDESNNAQSDLDAMNALLGQMSASLGGNDNSMDFNSQPEPAPAQADDNPWASLQAQLDEMDKSGNLGSDDSNGSEFDMMSEAPEVPNADDSSIWNFPDSASDSDDMSGDMSDDMSADLFSNF